MVASIASSMAGAAAPPVSALTLKPLSVHGLWLAVITIPAPALSSRVKKETTWVGTASGGVWHRMPCGGQDLDAGPGEVLGREPAVMGHHHPALDGPLFREVVRHAAGTAADIVEGEVFGDGRTPAIRPESDRGHGRGLW